MIRTTIGIILIISTFLSKVLFNHTIQYWFNVEPYWMFVMITGVLILLWPYLVRKNEKLKGVVTSIVLILVGGLTVFLLRIASEFLNNRIREYYLSQEVVITQGKVIDMNTGSFMKKESGSRVEWFYVIAYTRSEIVVEQWIRAKNAPSLKVGDNVSLIYSKKYPSIFRIVE